MTEIIGDTACPECVKKGHDKTGNHLMLFEDGGAFCNRCNYSEPAATFTKPTVSISDAKTPEEIQEEISKFEEDTTFKPIGERGLSAATCEFYGVRTQLSEMDGKTPVAWGFPLYKGTDSPNPELQGFKLRYARGKYFGKCGNTRSSLFFGAQCIPPKGIKLFITEGEFDAMALYETFIKYSDKKYHNRIAIVSLAAGAASAKKEIIRNSDLIEGYKEIVLVFDQDEAGSRAVSEVCSVIPRDKVRVARFTAKDPCEMVVQNQGRDLYFACIAEASKPKPEKILSGSEITLESLRTPLAKGVEIPYPELQAKLHGLRYGEGGGELTVLCAGTGMGKSTFAKELDHNLVIRDFKVGHIYLEENIQKSALGLIAIDNFVPVALLRENPNCITEKAFSDSYNKLINNDNTFYLSHFGSLASDQLMDYLYYMGVHEGCSFIFLDHISMVISGQESGAGGERKDIDILMTKLAAFCEDTGVSVIAIVHLNRPQNGCFNEGAQVSTRALRGSAAIEQLSHNIIAVEGNDQGDSPNERLIRVLKCREWGDKGEADTLEYNPETGRLLPKSTTTFGGGF